MGFVTPTQVNPNDDVNNTSVNIPINQLAAVINGQIDSTNLASASVDTSKIADGSVTNSKFSTTAGQLGGAWLSWTPTIGSGTGTITTKSGTGKYIQTGKIVNWQLAITITTNGTGAGYVTFTLPVNSLDTEAYVGSGRATASSGRQLQCRTDSANTVRVYDYSNAYPATSGEKLILSGTYESV